MDGSWMVHSIARHAFIYQVTRLFLISKRARLHSVVLSSLLLCSTLTCRRRDCSPLVRSTPIRSQLSVTHVSLGKLNFVDIGLNFLKNVVQYGVKRCLLATPCPIYILPIVLHWYLTGRCRSAVSMQHAQMGASLKVAAAVHHVDTGAFHVEAVLAFKLYAKISGFSTKG